MAEQKGAFGDPDDPRYYARTGDPTTSKVAAEQLNNASVHRRRILEALDKIGTGTFEDIADASGLRESQVWRRLSDLDRLGLAHTTGEERIGRSGRFQRVWARST